MFSRKNSNGPVSDNNIRLISDEVHAVILVVKIDFDDGSILTSSSTRFALVGDTCALGDYSCWYACQAFDYDYC